MAWWKHGGGFSIDGSVSIVATEFAGREQLLRYCAHPPFTLERPRDPNPERPHFKGTKPDPSGNGSLLQPPLDPLDRLAARSRLRPWDCREPQRAAGQRCVNTSVSRDPPALADTGLAT